MIDTPQSVMNLFATMMMKKSAEERLRMGCSMFEAAKQIVLTSVRDRHPGIGPAEMKRELFLRFYGEEFNERQKENILGSF